MPAEEAQFGVLDAVFTRYRLKTQIAIFFRNWLLSSHSVNAFFCVCLLSIDRMGATDNIYKGQSTFMVELQVSI